MSLGVVLLLLWIFVFDLDFLVGIVFLIIASWFGGDVDDVIVEKLEEVPHTQTLDKPEIPTETLTSKETCEAGDNVWVEDQKACY